MKQGRRRGKPLLSAGIRSILFVGMLLMYTMYEYSGFSNSGIDDSSPYRRLEESGIEDSIDEDHDACDELSKADPAWTLVFYFIGVLYMFIAIAIVCDELFVPALEEIASEHHMNLSMDVAGATLMAAGGSAPELFTSIFGTFVQQSEVGIGTVVGSAVFNVLFVIAMCALCANEVLELTWWPLFRDSFYYSLGLIALGVFVGVISPSEIEMWEAIVLFVMYIGYVVLMAYNRSLYTFLTGKELPDDDDDGGKEGENNNDAEAQEKNTSGKSLESGLTPPSSDSEVQWPGTFRSGILKLLRDPDSWMETAGVGIVSMIAGDVHAVFREVDIDANGEIDKDELAQLFLKLECNILQEDLDKAMKELDANNDGRITEEDFTTWYINSENRISSRVRPVFDKFDTDKSGTINKNKIKSLLESLEPSVTDKDVEEAMAAMHQSGPTDEISFEEFSNWYTQSLLYQRQAKKVEEDMECILDSLKPPSDAGFFGYLQYIIVLPLVAALGFTVPDVRSPGNGKYCYLSFILSILWIGVFSYFMVDWAETIGHTIGIPSVIMGLTLLAAGTSVPDLISSVIVARMGEGDMALSSSIGSNIFDILVGLPLPWIAYTAYEKTVITIGSDNVWLYIFTLLGMLVFVVTSTHCQGWRLTRTLAGLMLFFYFAFLALAITLELPFEIC